MSERITPVDSEDTLRRWAEDFARKTLGYAVFHPPNCKTTSGRWSSGSITGYPDSTFIRPPRVIFVEFKGVATPFTVKQYETLVLLRACPGVEAYLWRVGQISHQEIADILSPRRDPPEGAITRIPPPSKG